MATLPELQPASSSLAFSAYISHFYSLLWQSSNEFTIESMDSRLTIGSTIHDPIHLQLYHQTTIDTTPIHTLTTPPRKRIHVIMIAQHMEPITLLLIRDIPQARVTN